MTIPARNEMPGARLVLGPAEGRTRVPGMTVKMTARVSAAARYFFIFFARNSCVRLQASAAASLL